MKLLGVLLFFGLLGCSFARFDWDEEDNCPKEVGVVTDALCCEGDNFCTKISDKNTCKSEENMPYCVWDDDQCVPREDSMTNVCCRDKEVGDACDSVLKGFCPQDWQVDDQCCPDRKYSFLKTEVNKTCCNAPCKEMNDAGCTNLPTKCAPQQRSFSLHNPYHSLGFPREGNRYPHKFGRITYGTGYGYDTGYGYRRVKHGKHGHRDYKEEDDFDYSKDDHVDEITMDDVMHMLIEGLEKQTDVKLYDGDITSDPYLGKKKSGGLFLDHHFPHADKFFDRIYGDKGHYDHFVRPYEGYAAVYPEYEISRKPHYGPYQDYGYAVPHHGPHAYSSYPSYPTYEPHGYQSYPAPSYGYEPHGHYM